MTSEKISFKSILNEYIDNENAINKYKEKIKVLSNNNTKHKSLILDVIEKKYKDKPISFEHDNNKINFMKKCKQEIKSLSLKKIEELLNNFFDDEKKIKNLFNYIKNNREVKQSTDLILKTI